MIQSRLLRVLLLGLLALACLVPIASSDKTPTLRRWREFTYGRVRHDGVEYFDFDVTDEAFRVFLTFDRGQLDGKEGPLMLIKYGSIPTTNDFDQRMFLNGTSDFYSTKIDNLRTGHYFVALIGSKLYDSLTAFVGSNQPLFYFVTAWFFGCSDPSRTGSKCTVPVVPAQPVVSPTTTNVAAYYQNENVNVGCIDNTNKAIYYALDVAGAEWDLTLTLTTSSPNAISIVAGASLVEVTDVKEGGKTTTAKINAGSGKRSADLRVSVPRTGQWMVMVTGNVPRSASCRSGTGIEFSFVAKHERDCSKVTGGIVQANSSMPKVDLCALTFTRLNEIHYHPSKTDYIIDRDFETNSLVMGGNGRNTPATTQMTAGYMFDLPRILAGSNLVVDTYVTANIPRFQIYARVDAYPTASQYDYHFNSSAFLDVERADNTSNDWAIDVMHYTWSPVVFPKVGMWYLVAVADGGLSGDATKNSSFWAMDLSVHTYACPEESACSGHGVCDIAQTYGGLQYGACSCHYGYGGEQCDKLTLDAKFRNHQVFMLIASNAAILPVTILSCRRKLYLESVLFFLTGLISAIYHACDVEVYCMLPYKFLLQMDFALSFNMIMLLSVHFSGAHKQAKAGVQVFLLFATIVMATNNATSMANWVLIGAICVLQFSITLVYYFVLGSQRMGLGKTVALRAFVLHSNNFDPKYGILGLVLWLAALSCWFTSSPTNYWLIHSIWHMGAMLAAFCFIGFRRNDRYQMLTPVTGVDVLGPNYSAPPTAFGLKTFAASETTSVSTEKESSAVVEEV